MRYTRERGETIAQYALILAPLAIVMAFSLAVVALMGQ